MSTRIVLEFQHPLEAKDLAQLVALAEKLNASVVEVPNVLETHGKRTKQQSKGKQSKLSDSHPQPEKLNGSKLPILNLGFEKFPDNLDAFKVNPERLEALSQIFKDEPTAEELCEMLTP